MEVITGRRIKRPWLIYALTPLWAVKGFEELMRGVVGGGFVIASEVAKGALQGYPLQVAIQSLFYAAIMAAGSFYVMAALWLGKRGARAWGVAIACMSEIEVLTYLITRPPEFGGDIPLLRTVVVATIVNLGIIGVHLFDGRLAAFLGSPRLVGWWAGRR